MSTKFIHDNFLLENKYAEELYHNYSKNQPIIDYHNHLSPKQVAENKIFNTITDCWLGGDHYKWRAMRANAIPEKYITGNATDQEKFLKWAETVPYAMCNPLYHWTHLELKRYFGIDSLLNANSGTTIYNTANEHLNSPQFSTQGLLKKMIWMPFWKSTILKFLIQLSTTIIFPKQKTSRKIGLMKNSK